MGVLRRRSPWVSQPKVATGVNLANPCASGLVFCATGLYDSDSGSVASITGTFTSGVNSKGTGVGVANSSSVISFSNTATVNPVGSITCLAVGHIGSTAADASMVSKTTTNGSTNTPFNFGVGSGGGLILNRANGSGYRVWKANGSVVTAGVPFVSLVTAPTAIETQPSFWLNGAQNLSGCTNLYSGAGTGASTGNSLPIKVGNRDDRATWFNGGLINLVAVWNRSLSAPEIASVMSNPWQLFV